MERKTTREEAERWLAIATKLLNAKDLVGSRRFALRAQEKDPLWDGVDQVLMIADVLLAAEKRINNHMDWYAILQLDPRSNDPEHIKRQYRRLAFILHPDKNKSPLADTAFKFVSDAWAVLSVPEKKTLYDNELSMWSKFRPIVLDGPSPPPPHAAQPISSHRPAAAGVQGGIEQPVRRSPRDREKKRRTETETETETETGVEWQNGNNEGSGSQTRGRRVQQQQQSRLTTFWTACPYCYHLYEYPRVYEECVLKCQNCRRGFHAAVIPSPPPAVPGKDGYYCCWAFFPVGFSIPKNGKGGMPSWAPFSSMFATSSLPEGLGVGGNQVRVESGNEKEEEAGDGDESDESWDIGSEQKGKKIGKSPMSLVETRGRKANGSVAQGVNVDGVGVGGVGVPGVVRPTMRKKMMANRPKRAMGRPRRSSRIGGRADDELVDMDLNVELKDDSEEPVVDVGDGVEIESIEKEATEGSGFFEGLDDILGTLPILNVPVEQKAEEA